MTRLAVVALMTTLVTLSGCTGSLLDSKIPVPTIYVLAAAPRSEGATKAPGVDLAVSQPTTAPGLDTERIAVLKDARRLDYYREAQWGAALPQVAQSFVVASLRNQNQFRSVTTEQARVSANYLLDLEVRDFQSEYTSDSSAPTVRVTIVGSLIRIKDRKVIGVVPATATSPAAENSLTAVIAAFEAASRQVAVALGKQTADAIVANPN